MSFLRSQFSLSQNDLNRLKKIVNSRNEKHSSVVRAKILYYYSLEKTIKEIQEKLGISRPTIYLTIKKFIAGGLEYALIDRPRSGRPPKITEKDKLWVVNLACTKPKDHGYSYELWTYSLLVSHIQKTASQAGHPHLSHITRSMAHSFLNERDIKPHKVRYYVENRDPHFEEKMAEILCLYKEVQLQNEQEGDTLELTERPWVVISCDEKPGIQAIESTGKEILPDPDGNSCLQRDYEYRRHGTVSLLMGLDLHSGKVTGIVRDRHRSKEFIEFLDKLDKTYPPHLRLRLILDNHSIHFSQETQRWLENHPNRFEFNFTPVHGSWLNIIESLFSKLSRSFLRHIRVSSKEELKERIYQYFKELNAEPVVFRWKYKMNELI